MPKKSLFIKKEHRIQSQKAVEKAINICGSATALAIKMEICAGNLTYWKNGHLIIPLHRALQLSHILENEISFSDLRPDCQY